MKKKLLFILIVFTITLHGQNKLLSSISESYSGSNWNTANGSNYEYDTNGNLITSIEFEWNNTNQAWQNSFKEIYTYNQNNMGVTGTYQTWDTYNNSFQNSYKETYVYDANNNAEEIISEYWNGSEWVNENKTTIDYLNNLITEYTGYAWDGSQWVNESRGTFSYNSNNKCTGNTEYEWENSQWVIYSQDSYTYDSNDKLLSQINEKWESNNWVENFKNDYVLDNQGNRTSETEIYDNQTENRKTIYSFETTSLMSSFTHPFKDKTGLDYLFEDFPYVNKLLIAEVYLYNTGTGIYDIDSKTTYNYDSQITLNSKDFVLNKETLKLFPNPSSNVIQVSGLTETQNYEIYNILGANIKKGTITDNEKIDIKNLVNGLNFFKFQNGKTMKFIKE